MIKLDVDKLQWVQDALMKWSRKLGRRKIMGIFKDMYFKHSQAQRKRTKINLENPTDHFDFDENGDFVLSSKLLQCFIYFWNDKLEEAPTADGRTLRENKDNHSVDDGNAPSSSVLVSPFVRCAPVLVNSNQILTAIATESPTKKCAKDFQEVNKIMETCGIMSPSSWPKWICGNIEDVRNLAIKLFPGGDPEEVLLLAAFKIHPSGTLGKMLLLVIQAINMLKQSRSRKGETRKSNLCKFLEGTDPLHNHKNKSITASEVYNLYLHHNNDRFKIAQDLASLFSNIRWHIRL